MTDDQTIDSLEFMPLDGHSLLGRHRRKALLVERLQHPAFKQIKTAGGWTYWTGKGQFAGDHLYNLERDPFQLRNLARRKRGEAARLRKRVRRLDDCAAPCP